MIGLTRFADAVCRRGYCKLSLQSSTYSSSVEAVLMLLFNCCCPAHWLLSLVRLAADVARCPVAIVPSKIALKSKRRGNVLSLNSLKDTSCKDSHTSLGARVVHLSLRCKQYTDLLPCLRLYIVSEAFSDSQSFQYRIDESMFAIISQSRCSDLLKPQLRNSF